MRRTHEEKVGRQSGYAAARARKMRADAGLAELTLAKEQGQLVTVADYERELTQLLERLRAALLTLPNKWAPTLIGCRTTAEAQTRLEAAVQEAMEALRRSVDDISDEDGLDGVAKDAPSPQPVLHRRPGRPRGARTHHRRHR